MDNQQENMGYGFGDDTVKVSNIHFGGNFGNTHLTKFAFTDQGGKGGAQMDALDIVFNINGTDKGYRLFPISKVYSGGIELTDPTTKEYKDARAVAQADFNQRITHILKCFVTEPDIKTAFARPFSSFREFATVAQGLLPAGFDKIALDIFMEFQYNITGDNKQTFLQIPQKMKNGAFVVRAVPGKWTKVIADDGSLSYKDETTQALHPFQRSAWYMSQPYANQKKEDDGTVSGGSGQQIGSEPSAAANTTGATGW